MSERTLTDADVEAIADAIARRMGSPVEWLTVDHASDAEGFGTHYRLCPGGW